MRGTIHPTGWIRTAIKLCFACSAGWSEIIAHALEHELSLPESGKCLLCGYTVTYYLEVFLDGKTKKRLLLYPDLNDEIPTDQRHTMTDISIV